VDATKGGERSTAVGSGRKTGLTENRHPKHLRLDISPPASAVRLDGVAARPISRSTPGFPPAGGDVDIRTAVYAALDLGTNNCRLLIARPSVDGFRIIDAFSRIVRLGEGAGVSGRLSDSAMQRTVRALQVCVHKMVRQRVTRARLVATEACRTAGNGDDFIALVRRETGIELEVIDRETEARLAVAGTAPLFDTSQRDGIVFDIGGGSTEVMYVTFRNGDYTLRDWVSLPLGVVTLAERHGGVDVPPDAYAAMVADVARALQPFVRLIASAYGVAGRPPGCMLGTSGTVTTIAGVQLELPRYDRSRVDGCWLTADEIASVTRRLLSMTYEERTANPCVGRDRADLVLAGCAILEAILAAWPCPRVRVADRGLREGMLTELMQQDGTFGRDCGC